MIAKPLLDALPETTGIRIEALPGILSRPDHCIHGTDLECLRMDIINIPENGGLVGNRYVQADDFTPEHIKHIVYPGYRKKVIGETFKAEPVKFFSEVRLRKRMAERITD
jgi:hypothetical protein